VGIRKAFQAKSVAHIWKHSTKGDKSGWAMVKVDKKEIRLYIAPLLTGARVYYRPMTMVRK